MSGSNRDDLASAFRLAIYIITAFGALTVIWQVSGVYAERRQNTEHRANQYAESADRRIANACGRINGPALIECVTKEVKTSREDERTEYDLQAQQDSADAAFWMAIISFLTLSATIVALWFVKGTLDATREAVKDTGEATEAMREANAIAADAQRAWIDISLKVERLVTTERNIKLHYKVAFKNIGQSIATNVWTNVKVDCFGSKASAKIHHLRDFWWGENKGPSTIALMPGECWEHEAELSLAKSALEWAGEKERMISLGALASAFYNLRGKPDYGERRRTDRYFRIGLWNENPILGYFILEEDVRDVRAVEINIVKSKNTITT